MSTFPAPAAEFDLDIYRGDTYRWQFTLWQDLAKTIPVDLTGAAAASQIRDRPQGTQIANMSCVITPPNTVAVTLSSATSHTLPVKGAWDLELTYASGDVQTPVGGNVSVTPDVTNSTT